MSEDKKRFYFIDQFRGWAVVFMVETHVVNAFLHYGLRSSLAYKALDFFNGLIAPAFLFIAGFSFAIVAERKWDDFQKPGKVFWKQFQRCLQILHDLRCKHVWIGQGSAVLQALVAQPEDVEVDLVTRQ